MKKTQRKSSKKQNRYRELAFRIILLTSVALISGVAGVATAFVMSATPLRTSSAHRPKNRITSLFPGSLARPINIMVLGIDNSGHPHIGNFTPAEALSGNSDTMLLVRLDPDRKQVNVLSIPRDTQVQLPGVGLDKINDANVQGGVSLAESSVSRLLSGIQIDRYVRVDTEELVHLIDAIGGLEVNVPKQMDYVDHAQNLMIHFAPGVQKLNGQHLQEYVRYRHDELGDIGRVQRQQEVLKALLLKLIQPQMLTKLPKVMQVVQQNTDTDLSLEEMLAIYRTMTTVPRSQMNLVMLPGRFSGADEFPLSYWVADPNAIPPILSRYFTVAALPQKAATEGLSQMRSQMRIAIVAPQSEAVSEAASEAVEVAIARLKQRGFSNVYRCDHDPASNLDSKTQVVAEHGNPEVAESVRKALSKNLSSELGQVQVASIGDLTSDVTIFLGSDFF